MARLIRLYTMASTLTQYYYFSVLYHLIFSGQSEQNEYGEVNAR